MPHNNEEEEPFINRDDEVERAVAVRFCDPKKPRHAVAVPVREGARSSIIKSGVLLFLFFGVNIIINVFNKWEFNGPLRCPMYVTITHQVICFICCLSLSPWIHIAKVEGTKSRMQLFLIPVFFVGNIAMNNLSLLYTTLALNQLIRAFCPVVVAVLAFFIEDKKPTILSSTSILCLVLGVTLSVTTSPDLEFLGTIICFGSVLGNALQTVLISVLKIVRLDPISIIYHTSLMNSLLMVPMFFALGEHHQLVQHVEEQGLMEIMGLTVAGGAIAFAYNVILLSFIQNTSSVYSSVAGSFKTVLILWISFMFFNQSLNMLSLIGILIACVAFVCNSVIMIYEKRRERQKQIEGEDIASSSEFPPKGV
eukprot:CAMPEP_0114522452 /NCGR_PEP_ID=MMETSP0109-20121206/20747_1 /TAXON_ID=29199 /ORGANISM="Chlorarachnion reptans, Strain CCCM449" /LENGTH=365 /DNA_ID=CAMNT_0001703665 /DNA_START=143 /DNA_END=1240 /DNA_ORIENTATION=-